MKLLKRSNFLEKFAGKKVDLDGYTFNIIDIRHGDTCLVEEDDDGEDGDENASSFRYQIQLFGTMINGETIQVDINNFNPFFYIAIPDGWKPTHKRIFLNYLVDKIPYKFKSCLLIDECIIVKREKYYGFTNHKKYKFLKLVFNNYEAMRKCVWKFNYPFSVPGLCRATKFELYENKMDPNLRFLHMRELDAAGWANVQKYKTVHKRISTSRCTYNIECKWQDVFNVSTLDFDVGQMYAPFLSAAFDIECSSTDGGFPKSHNPGDKVIMVATTFRFAGEAKSDLCVIHHLKASEPVDGCVMIECETEKDLLEGWAKLIRDMDPEIIYGYNSSGFDFKYMYERSNMMGCKREFLNMSRQKDIPGVWTNKILSSSAMGQNVLNYVEMHGRIVMDVMKEIQKELVKLEMYKLDYVLKWYLGDAKVDLSPAELFAKYKRGTKKDIRDIGIYCFKDTDSCHDLVWCKKLNLLVKAIKLADVCMVPLLYIFTRGQSIRLYSLIGNECTKAGYLIPEVKKIDYEKIAQGDANRIVIRNNDLEEKTDEFHDLLGRSTPHQKRKYLIATDKPDYVKLFSEIIKDEYKNQEKYEGAIVFEATPGIFHEPVIVNDFASLYPNCQRAWNLSHDTLVMDPAYDNLPGLEYEHVEYKQPSGEIKICKFVQVTKDGQHRGIMPYVIDKLLKARKDTRAKIKTETNPEVIRQLDALQLTYKVIVNSLYGLTGAAVSPLYLKDVAACTTALGRRNLKLARDTALGLYPDKLECIYGDTDSVFFLYKSKRLRKLNKRDDISLEEINKIVIERSIKMGHKIAEAVNIAIGKPGIMNFEYEKTFRPFLQVSKKRYYGRKFEEDPNEYKDTVMGLATKRRNYCKYVKDTMQHIFDLIMNSTNNNIHGITEYIIGRLNNLVEHKVPLDELKITASLKDSYKNENVAHNQLAIRMRNRGETVNANDRIAFIYSQTAPEYNTIGNPKKKLDAEIVEELGYAKKNKLIYDAEKYITGQFREPVSQCLEFLVDDSKEIFDEAIKKCRKELIKIYGPPVIPSRKKNAN